MHNHSRRLQMLCLVTSRSLDRSYHDGLLDTPNEERNPLAWTNPVKNTRSDQYRFPVPFKLQVHNYLPPKSIELNIKNAIQYCHATLK